MEIEGVEIWHASDPVARRVRAWFENNGRVGVPDGSRSVHLPHPEKRVVLKVKGAGFHAGPIRFGVFSRTGPTAALFDFEGRMMEDIAFGHDNAFLGGASFQQAVTEFKVTQIFVALGIPVVPCLGYGRIEAAGHVSWFSIFEWYLTWENVLVSSSVPLAEYLEAYTKMGAFLVRLASEHDLIGHCWWVRDQDGTYLVKDLHPFRHANPVNMSQLSWVMQVIFALHICCQACRNHPRAAKVDNLPLDVAAYPLRPIVPNATAVDHDELKASIVRPYMMRPPPGFTPLDLLRALKTTRVGRVLLDICPARYAHW